MAFNSDNLYLDRATTNSTTPEIGVAFHKYKSNTDNIGTITTAGYFNQAYQLPPTNNANAPVQIQIGDAMMIKGTDGTVVYQITAVTPNITMTPLVTNVMGALIAANNLSDLANKATSRTNLQVPAINRYAGNPNTHVAGALGDLTVNTLNNTIYSCTTAGNAALAVWSVSTGAVTSVTTHSGIQTGDVTLDPTDLGLADNYFNAGLQAANFSMPTPIPSLITIGMTLPSLKLIMPVMNSIPSPLGLYEFTVLNISSQPFDLVCQDGTTLIATIPGDTLQSFYVVDISTPNGTFLSLPISLFAVNNLSDLTNSDNAVANLGLGGGVLLPSVPIVGDYNMPNPVNGISVLVFANPGSKVIMPDMSISPPALGLGRSAYLYNAGPDPFNVVLHDGTTTFLPQFPLGTILAPNELLIYFCADHSTSNGAFVGSKFVATVNNKTGNVVLVPSDLGLGAPYLDGGLFASTNYTIPSPIPNVLTVGFIDAGNKIIMPVMNTDPVPLGQYVFTINNLAEAADLVYQDGVTVIATIPAASVQSFVVTDNSTANGVVLPLPVALDVSKNLVDVSNTASARANLQLNKNNSDVDIVVSGSPYFLPNPPAIAVRVTDANFENLLCLPNVTQFNSLAVGDSIEVFNLSPNLIVVATSGAVPLIRVNPREKVRCTLLTNGTANGTWQLAKQSTNNPSGYITIAFAGTGNNLDVFLPGYVKVTTTTGVNDDISLPDATNTDLPADGAIFFIENDVANLNNVSLKDFTGTTLITITPGQTIQVILTNGGTAAGVWSTFVL